jgi:hypothetical protein
MGVQFLMKQDLSMLLTPQVTGTIFDGINDIGGEVIREVLKHLGFGG